MSIVHLSSLGQNPANFSNSFPSQINLAPQSEVRCLGYSGVQADIVMDHGGDTAHAITIKEGLNDSFVVYHGEINDGVDPDHFQNVPFVCTIPAGTYSLNYPVPSATVKCEFAAAMTTALNNCENCGAFYGNNGMGAGWDVIYNPANGQYIITTIQGRNRRAEAGMWDHYLEPLGTIGVPASAGLPTILDPQLLFPPPKNVGGIFINKRQAFLGSNNLTTATPTLGFEMTLEMDPGGSSTFGDCAVTHGLVPLANLTVWEQVSNTSEIWTDRKANIKRNPLAIPNSLTDWAFPNGASNHNFALPVAQLPTTQGKVPWVVFGMTVSPLDGRVGIVESKMFADNGSLKQPDNQQITWYPTVVDITAGSEVKLMMSPRFNTTTDEYEMLFQVDNNTGTYVTLTTITYGAAGDPVNLMAAEHLYHTVWYDPDYITGEVVSVGVMSQNKWNVENGSPVGTQPDNPITIIWQPLTSDLINCPKRLMQTCQALSLEHCNGLGAELGFDDYYLQIVTASPSTTWPTVWPPVPLDDGWQSDVKFMAIPVSPLIICCPSLLGIEGYLGGAAGGQAQILAVTTLRNKVGGQGFSGLTNDHWIKLNNEYPLRIDQLNIKLVDQTNREYKGLMADFSCWLQFRCPSAAQNFTLKGFGGTSS